MRWAPQVSWFTLAACAVVLIGYVLGPIWQEDHQLKRAAREYIHASGRPGSEMAARARFLAEARRLEVNLTDAQVQLVRWPNGDGATVSVRYLWRVTNQGYIPRWREWTVADSYAPTLWQRLQTYGF